MTEQNYRATIVIEFEAANAWQAGEIVNEVSDDICQMYPAYALDATPGTLEYTGEEKETPGEEP